MYKIYKGKEQINLIVADKLFVEEYCNNNGYTFEYIEDIGNLEQEKNERILKSKNDLEVYLSMNPLQWIDGNYYSITAEKQSQLTSKLAVAQAKETAGIPYELKWNTTNEVCVPWELNDLLALAFAIDERVTALVSYQQEKEVAIRNAETKEILDSIVIDYNSVDMNNESEKI